jgi:hypothetical protein
MKSVVSLVLVVAVVISAVPIAAQEWIDPAAGPIHRAMAREAFRLSTQDVTPSVVKAAVDKSGQSDWSRVRDVEGEEIILTVHGSPPGKRWVVRNSVDSARLTVLNLTGPTIPAAVVDELSGDASLHPEYFNRAQRGVTVRVNKRVRLAPDGVFLDDKKVAELEQVIQPVARDSVAEIIHMSKHIGRHAMWGALVGGGVGAALGWLSTTDCKATNPSDQHLCDEQNVVGAAFGGALLGALPGALFGALIGAVDPKTPDVIYRAP